MEDNTMGKPNREAPDAELRAKIKRCAEVLTAAMDKLGWDPVRLALATGYTTSFVRGTANNTLWGLPSRPALRFMLDVMGADTSSPDVVEVLGWCPRHGVARGDVKRKMNAFYGRQAGTRADDPPLLRHDYKPPTTSAGASRKRAVDSIIEDLISLLDVDEADVVEWVKAHADDLSESTRYEIMRALWAT